MKTEDKIRHQLATNPIILYMKGIPANPQCGFSAKSVGILNATNIPYAYVNVLEAPFIREKLPSISTGRLIRNCLLTANWSAVATSLKKCPITAVCYPY